MNVLRFRCVRLVAKSSYFSFVTSDRLSAYTSAAPIERISVEFESEDCYEKSVDKSKFG